MRNILLVTMYLFVLLFSISYAGEPIGSFKFRMNMHEIFQNYRGIYISTREGFSDAANAHIHLMRSHIKNIYPLIPDRDAEGGLIDKKAFAARLDGLDRALEKLGEAVKDNALQPIADLPRVIFTICAGCHSEAKLKYMFRLPSGQLLLGEYMHSVAEDYELARLYLETGEREKANDHLFIVNEYLALIKKVFPDKGPTGVVMDRNRLKNQIALVEKDNNKILADMKSGKSVEFDTVKKSLNSICISCHEPEKIK